MKQKYAFIEGEGDAWFDRNHQSLGLYDPVTPVLDEMMLHPARVLEVGCANGWRLAKLRDKFRCEVTGVEPSMKAGMAGAGLRVPIYQMTASTLPVDPDSFDLIIYGFCLYLTDPDDWLTIAAEADRVLKVSGHIVIHDFNDWIGGAPISKHYEHKPGLRSYHYDFAKLWMGHPRYQVVLHRDGAHDDGVTVIRKNVLTTRSIP